MYTKSCSTAAAKPAICLKSLPSCFNYTVRIGSTHHGCSRANCTRKNVNSLIRKPVSRSDALPLMRDLHPFKYILQVLGVNLHTMTNQRISITTPVHSLCLPSSSPLSCPLPNYSQSTSAHTHHNSYTMKLSHYQTTTYWIIDTETLWALQNQQETQLTKL